MITIYATMMADEKMLINDKIINKIIDNIYFENKIIVMDEEYYFKYAGEFDNTRIIVISNNKLSQELDVECYENIYKIANSKYFKEKELYIIGSNKLIKEAIPLATKMEFNIVDMYLKDDDKVSNPFPKYDNQNWQYKSADIINPRITRIVLERINPYNFKPNNPKKRVKK